MPNHEWPWGPIKCFDLSAACGPTGTGFPRCASDIHVNIVSICLRAGRSMQLWLIWSVVLPLSDPRKSSGEVLANLKGSGVLRHRRKVRRSELGSWEHLPSPSPQTDTDPTEDTWAIPRPSQSSHCRGRPFTRTCPTELLGSRRLCCPPTSQQKGHWDVSAVTKADVMGVRNAAQGGQTAPRGPADLPSVHSQGWVSVVTSSAGRRRG